MTENKVQKFEEQSWYIIVNNETRGPLSLRDLDVLLRTSEINSFTYAWKNGMKQWKLMPEIEELKQSILESSKQMFEIEKKRGDAQPKINQQKKQEGDEAKNEDQTIQNKDQNVLTILEATVDNLIQKTFHQTQDGKWNMFDEQKGEWIQQLQEPTQKMQMMKKNLLNKLKNQLFFDQKNNFKRNKRTQNKQEDQRQLTKQELAKRQKNRKKAKRAAEKKKQKWYQAKVNTFIYITGLPLDITEEQLKQFCSKAGILRIDLNVGKQKIKIYKDQNGMPKGDAAASYARPQSVQIALQMLNQGQIRSGFKVKVERAQFHQKAEQYIPRQSKKESKIKKIQAKKLQNKLFGWNQQDQQTGDGLKILIIKNVFTPEMIQDENLIQSIKQDIQKQAESYGQVQRIRFYQTHPEGVVQVKFKNEKDAQICVQTLDRKIFHDRQLQCEYWDGQTDYKHNSVSLMLQNERLEKFANEIEGQDNQKALQETQKDKQINSGQK